MAKVSKVRRKSVSRRYRGGPYFKPSSKKITHGVCEKKCYHASEKIDWTDSTCSVCMEAPHNAVLLLCSSYNKGCRPYMCATSYRHSNCLDQYKKAYTKVISVESTRPGSEFELGLSLPDDEKKELTELLCPLCRGQLKGWTVVEPARQYLNAKKRSCMQENCSFVGTFKQLRKHVKAEHPLARPREVDPTVEANWNRLHHLRETSDVISTIRSSSTPNAFVLGDFVVEANYPDLYSNPYENNYFGEVFSPLGILMYGRRRWRHTQSEASGE